MKKTGIASLCIAVTAAVCLALFAAPRLALSSVPTEEAARVRLTEVRLGEIHQTLSVSGRVRGVQEYAALAPASGIVAQVLVRPGDRVAAGAPLFRMDTALQEQALQEALAARDAAEVWAQEAIAALPLDLADPAQAFQGQMSADVRAAQLALDQSTVRAQANGYVAQVNAASLSAVAAGTPVVLLRGEEQKVQCSVVARDAQKLTPGMAATLSSGDEVLGAGVVAQVGPAEVDTLTGQTVCPVTVLPEETLSLPLGAPVDVAITLARRQEVAVLPLTAVTDAGTVWWAADGRGYEVPVTVVLADDEACWVTLPVGTVVVDGTHALAEGQRIKELKK